MMSKHHGRQPLHSHARIRASDSVSELLTQSVGETREGAATRVSHCTRFYRPNIANPVFIGIAVALIRPSRPRSPFLGFLQTSRWPEKCLFSSSHLTLESSQGYRIKRTALSEIPRHPEEPAQKALAISFLRIAQECCAACGCWHKGRYSIGIEILVVRRH